MNQRGATCLTMEPTKTLAGIDTAARSPSTTPTREMGKPRSVCRNAGSSTRKVSISQTKPKPMNSPMTKFRSLRIVGSMNGSSEVKVWTTNT